MQLSKRTATIRKAMRPYWVNQTTEEGLIDALTDLMHWADLFNEGFNEALATATRHYYNERFANPQEDN